jgi:hypothetical protein
MLKNLALVFASVLGAAVFIGSCSDDTSGADAAVCDCDPAEPPLAGRITRVEVRTTAALSGFLETARCPANSTLLGGGCYSEGTNRLDVRLIMAGEQVPAGDLLSYGCAWDNDPGLEVTVVAWAKCLIPAP